MSAQAEAHDRPDSDDPEPDFTRLFRLLGGGVVWANDELFAERENLIKPEEPRRLQDDLVAQGRIDPAAGLR